MRTSLILLYHILPVEFKGIVNRVLTTVARLSPEAGRQETLNTAQVLTQQQATSGEQNTCTLCTNQYIHVCAHRTYQWVQVLSLLLLLQT